jgi:hypothetical protein
MQKDLLIHNMLTQIGREQLQNTFLLTTIHSSFSSSWDKVSQKSNWNAKWDAAGRPPKIRSRKQLRDASVVEHHNAARRQSHEAERLDPVVRELENVTHQESRLDCVVRRERENVAHQEGHEQAERLDPVVREREHVACQEIRLDPVVRERENVTRKESHEAE